MRVSPQRSAADTILDDARLDDATLAVAVREAVQALPQHLRTVLYLTDVQGLSYGQAAKVMGTSEGVVASEKRRARGWLRARLDLAIRQVLRDKPTHRHRRRWSWSDAARQWVQTDPTQRMRSRAAS